MREHGPWVASGTGTFPKHRFLFTPADDPDTVLKLFVVGEYPENLYVYDPYLVEGDPEATEKNLKEHLTTQKDRDKYESWRKTLSFNEQYLKFKASSESDQKEQTKKLTDEIEKLSQDNKNVNILTKMGLENFTDCLAFLQWLLVVVVVDKVRKLFPPIPHKVDGV